MPAHESLHFLKGNGAIVVGIHRLEYALVSRLKLLQRELPVSVSVHQTENYSHHHRTSDARAASIPVLMPETMSHHSVARHSHHSRVVMEEAMFIVLLFATFGRVAFGSATLVLARICCRAVHEVEVFFIR